MCCSGKSQPISAAPDSSLFGIGQQHGPSRTLLRASKAAEVECTENIIQSDSGGVENGEIEINVTVPASSKNATAKIFPRQTPVQNTSTELFLEKDTCEGILCHWILHNLIYGITATIDANRLLNYPCVDLY